VVIKGDVVPGGALNLNSTNHPFLQNVTQCTGAMNILINIDRMDKYEEIRLLAQIQCLKERKL
jgi:hypothetical protein